MFYTQNKRPPCTKSCRNGTNCKWSGDAMVCINTCNKNCGPHGTCTGSGSSSTCQCVNGYYGEYCNIKTCENNCNGRGTCNNGKCYCNTGKLSRYHIYIYKVISIRHHWTEFAPRRPFRSAFKNFKSSVLILEADGPIITT